jgi:hypothetical protein
MSARASGVYGNVTWVWLPSNDPVANPKFWSAAEPNAAVNFEGTIQDLISLKIYSFCSYRSLHVTGRITKLQ